MKDKLTTLRDYRVWLAGILSGCIRGAAMAVLAGVGTNMGEAVGLMTGLNWGQVGSVALAGAFVQLCIKLSQTPLPTGDEVDEEAEPKHTP